MPKTCNHSTWRIGFIPTTITKKYIPLCDGLGSPIDQNIAAIMFPSNDFEAIEVLASYFDFFHQKFLFKSGRVSE
jgi:hypothetical protein